MGDGISPVLGFVAGVLTILSPCILPLVPIVISSARSGHRSGPIMLSLGLALSFATLGMFIATIGFSVGLDSETFRTPGALALVAAGALLLFPTLQRRLEALLVPLGALTGKFTTPGNPASGAGQFMIGALLGLVWLPCVGPTLGAASLLAARGESIPQVATVMFAFGLGATVPLIAIGALSARLVTARRASLISAGIHGKRLLGAGLLVVGVLIVSGLEHRLEAHLAMISPDWLLRLTTRI